MKVGTSTENTASVKIGKTADELLEERVEKARAIFDASLIALFEVQGRRDATRNQYAPPTREELALLEDVYMQAYNRRRYKIAKAKRDE